LGDGSQIRSGFCSPTAQGALPSTERMVSTLITSPANNANLTVGQEFTVRLNVANLDTGFFSDPQTLYYAQPQALNARGIVQGHQHVTIQKLPGAIGSKLQAAPDAKVFQFFKGLNDAADGQGNMETVVPAATFTASGPGLYRICSLSGSFTHQPVVMPVAQRGAQDDCIRVNVR
ncbi:hypothetical protein DFS34DRAFT_581762, partial [Phlyctochytrium arcticum]